MPANDEGITQAIRSWCTAFWDLGGIGSEHRPPEPPPYQYKVTGQDAELVCGCTGENIQLNCISYSSCGDEEINFEEYRCCSDGPAGYEHYVCSIDNEKCCGGICRLNEEPCCIDADNDGYDECNAYDIPLTVCDTQCDCDDDTSDDPDLCTGITATDCTNQDYSVCAVCINPDAEEVCDCVDNNCQELCDASPSSLTDTISITTTPDCTKIDENCVYDVDVSMQVERNYKIAHLLPRGEMEYETDGLVRLTSQDAVNAGKCQDCGSLEERNKITGMITEWDDLSIEATVSGSCYNRVEFVILEVAPDGTLSPIIKEDMPFSEPGVYSKVIKQNLNRGKKIKAKVNVIRNSEVVRSGETDYYFVVAGYNYFFVHSSPGPKVDNYRDNYKYYVDLSAINNNIALSGKPIYFIKKCKIGRLLFFPDKEFYRGVLKKSDKCVKKWGFNWDKSKDAVIALSDKLGGGRCFTRRDEDTVFTSSKERCIAHELGHVYGICDEYRWKRKGRKTGYFEQQPCDNGYPWCCLDNPTNPLHQTLTTKQNEIYQDGKTFSEWVTYEWSSLTDSQLEDLRYQSPCAKTTTASTVCHYTDGDDCPILDEDMLTLTHTLLRDDPDNKVCPPEKKVGAEPARCCVEFDYLESEGITNCYEQLYKDAMDPSECVGMPLSDTGEEGDLTSEYRSIMGRKYLDKDKFERQYPFGSKLPLREE